MEEIVYFGVAGFKEEFFDFIDGVSFSLGSATCAENLSQGPRKPSQDPDSGLLHRLLRSDFTIFDLSVQKG